MGSLHRRGRCSSVVTQHKMTSGLFSSYQQKIGPKDNATILKFIWHKHFLPHLLPLHSRSKIRILMTSWQ